MAPELLGQVDLAGRVVTGDALYAQKNLSRQVVEQGRQVVEQGRQVVEQGRQVVEQGGDYFWVVKDNQPTLRADIALLFAEAPWGEELATAGECGRHGDRWEERTLWTSTALNEYLDWPQVRQVCCVERKVTRKGATRKELAYASTSLSPAQAGPQELLCLWRSHWEIENRLHYVRDVTMKEDAIPGEERVGAPGDGGLAQRDTGAVATNRGNQYRGGAATLQLQASGGSGPPRNFCSLRIVRPWR